MKPFIGITGYRTVDAKTGWEYSSTYAANVRVVERAGGLPLIIPCGLAEEDLRAIFNRLDGLMLPGGGDVNPERYASVTHPGVYAIEDNRDETEILLTQWAVESDYPLLGICRGMQVMNVAMGGDLIQDIPTLLETEIPHKINPVSSGQRHTILHTVEIQSDSRLAAILGAGTHEVNSIHHQSVDRVAAGFKVTATAPDGVIEAIEMPDKPFIIAVQWHPEDMILNGDEKMAGLLEEFIQIASEHQKK